MLLWMSHFLLRIIGLPKVWSHRVGWSLMGEDRPRDGTRENLMGYRN